MNIKQMFVAIVCLLATINTTAQFTISGNVSSNKNIPIDKATIYIADSKLGTVTNSNGLFAIKNLKQGIYLLEISANGYKNEFYKIILDKNINLIATLNPAIAELNSIIVTGVSRSTELRNSPIIATVLDKNSFNQNSATNLIDGLKNIAGINQISTGVAISKPVIRGLGYNRVISLHNGIRQEGQQWGDEHGIEIDEYAIDRIEIIKGPGSLLYGSDGIAGVINFLAPKMPAIGQIKTQCATNFQSNNNLIGYSIANSGNKKGIQWLARLTNKFAGNYQNKYDGKVLNSGFSELDGNAFIGINKNWGHTHINFSTFNTTINLVEGDRDSNGKFIFLEANGTEKTATNNDLSGYKKGFPYQSIHHIGLSINNYFILKKGTLNIDLGIQNNKRKEFGDVTNPKDIALFFDMNTFNYNTKFNFSKVKGWESSIGISGMLQQNGNKGLEFLIPAYQSFDAGIFAFSQKQFKNKCTIAGGVRIDNRRMQAQELLLDSVGVPTNNASIASETKFTGFHQNYNSISGSIGVAYPINTHHLIKLNISRGFRAPNIAEIASNGRHEGTYRYEYGVQNLKSEISHQFDLGYFFNSDHIIFECTPFVNMVSNYIYASKLLTSSGTDSIPDLTDPAPAYIFTQGNTILSGAEIFIDVHPHPLDWLHIENSFSFVQAQQLNQPDSTENLPFIPAPKYRCELKSNFSSIGKHLQNSYLKFGVDYFFNQNKIYGAYNTETATPAYTLLSAGAGTNIKIFKNSNSIQLYISAENIADIGYQNHLSRLKYAPQNLASGRNGVFNMGRNISAKVIFNF